MIRLFVQQPLQPHHPLDITKEQAHYLHNVMRKAEGDRVLLFNGKDGEWQSRIDSISKKAAMVTPLEQTRPQQPEPDIWLYFAPIKFGRIDYLVQKATELGVAGLQPIFTERTQVTRINRDRLRANAIEAAEQCERLNVPEVAEPVRLKEAIQQLQGRTLIFCDETGSGKPMHHALNATASSKAAIFIGPEGGFSPDEQTLLKGYANIVAVSLGPRVLRADTAALAALTIWQTLHGDFDGTPHFEGN